MGFKNYWRGLSPEEKKAFCERVGTSYAYLSLISGGHRKPNVDLSKRLVQASDYQLTLEDLRPDWAELTPFTIRRRPA